MDQARTQHAAGIYLLYTVFGTHDLHITYHWSCLNRSVYGRSVADHLEYYGVSLHADSRGTCQFVIGSTNMAYGTILEVDRTIIMTRYPQEWHAVESI
jgi:hypothetical protein